MPHAKLAALLPPLLIQSIQGVEDSLLLRLVLFAAMPVVLFLFAGGYLAFITLFFGTFAVPPVFGIQWLYRRSVLRWMNVPGGDAGARGARTPDAPAPTRAPPGLRIETQEPDAPGGVADSPLSRRAVEASGAVTRVYVAAAAACAVVLTPLVGEIGPFIKEADRNLRSLTEGFFYAGAFAVLTWLPLLTFMVTAVGRTLLKLILLAAYTLLLTAPVLFLPPEQSTPAVTLLVGMWCLLLAPTTGTLLVLRLSGVGGLALGMIFALSAPVLAGALKVVISSYEALERRNSGGAAESAGLPDVAFLASVVLLVVGPFVAALAAAGLVWWLGNRYARKETSRQLLLLDIFWLVTIFIVSLICYACGVGWYTLLGPLSFAVYKLVVWAGLRRLRPEAGAGRRELRLLFLRVFGAKRRSEWLLKRLGLYWLYSGSIQLIAAPDLAAANLDLDEMLDFLRGRLKDRFVKDSDDCRRRVKSLDVRPDPDGRYRVNEFFCHEDVWFETVCELTARSDAVLMDLRGFTEANHGCVRELRHVVDAVSVNQLVVIVNAETQIDFLRRTFHGAWALMDARSPNRGLAAPVLRLLNVRQLNSRAVRRLLSMLYEAAEAPRPAARSEGAAVVAAPAGLVERAT